MKKIIATLLSLLMVASFAVGCKGEDSTGSTGNSDSTSSSSASSNEAVETGDYIIQNGKTQYQIVYPEGAGSNIITAISELNLFMSEATGVKFTAVPDTGVTYSADSRYISIGNTALVEQAGVDFSDELAASGTHLITKDKTVFLYGETERSSLYAVYDFLADVIHWDYFGLEAYYVDTNVENVPLKAYDNVNIPDFEVRATSYGYQVNNPVWANRMRTTNHFEEMPEVKGYIVHNSFGFVQDYIAGHEGAWYSDDKIQLCYTAHTSKADRYKEGSEYLQMLEACTKTAIQALKQYPDTHILAMTQQDEGTWCGCENCNAVKLEYGATSALLVLFMNDLRDRIDEWFETEEGQEYYREVDLAFFAYQMSVDAPATKNANGEWEANKGYDGEPIHCDDGVVVWYAPINADFMQSVYAPVNQPVLNAIEGWTAVSDEMMLWFYDATFRQYMNYYDTFDYMQEWYQVAKKSGATYMFNQAQIFVSENAYSWGMLKSYLMSKLAWDVDADYGYYLNKWFENYYGPIADSMKTLFTAQRVHFNALKEKGVGYGGSTSSMIDVRAEYFPKPVLNSWVAMCDAVLEEMKPLKKTDEALYETYYLRMAAERISVYYLYVTLYEGSTDEETIMQYKLQFKEDVRKLGVEMTNEGSVSITSILTNWGIA